MEWILLLLLFILYFILMSIAFNKMKISSQNKVGWFWTLILIFLTILTTLSITYVIQSVQYRAICEDYAISEEFVITVSNELHLDIEDVTTVCKYGMKNEWELKDIIKFLDRELSDTQIARIIEKSAEAQLQH